MASTNNTSDNTSLDGLADIFLPSFCKYQHIGSSPKVIEDSNFENSVVKCVCNHKKSCKVCLSLKETLSLSSQEKIEISREVKSSGLYNFEGCRIPVNNRIDTDFIKQMLHGYNDMLVCDLLKYVFPIDVTLEDKKVSI